MKLLKKIPTQAYREWFLLTVGATMPILLSIIVTKGIFHITKTDAENLCNAALAAYGTALLLFVTPLTRRYGVGATNTPAQSDAITWADVQRRPAPDDPRDLTG